MNQWKGKLGKGVPKNVTVRNRVILAVVSVIMLASVWLVSGLSRPRGLSAVRLNCYASQSVTPFGEYVLYYDGVSIHCLTHSGAVRWSLAVGEGAGFSVGARHMAVWVNTQMYILDYGGRPTYQDTLGDVIQFVRIGSRYAAAVIGPDTSPMLVVRDMRGTQVDKEADAFRDAMILDVGFYGDQGQYMWVTLLDMYGTVSGMTLKTFEVGKKNTGESMLGESTPYRVLFENGRLRVITTRQMHTYNFQGIESTADAMLVYGWQLVDAEIPLRGDAVMLFAPTAQTGSILSLSELRYLTGTTDRRFTLPTACVGAVVYGRAIYAFAPDFIYRAEANAQRFTAYELPVQGRKVTQVIGLLEGGRVLLACTDDVYVVSLPGD